MDASIKTIEREKYNGWSNYPTWCVNLWIDNDETIYNEIYLLAEDCYNDAEDEEYHTREERAILDFKSILRNYIEELDYLDNSSMFADLLSWALEEVNWYELSKSIIMDNVVENSK